MLTVNSCYFLPWPYFASDWSKTWVLVIFQMFWILFLWFFLPACISSVYCFGWCILRCVKRLDMFLPFANTGFTHDTTVAFSEVIGFPFSPAWNPKLFHTNDVAFPFETSSHIVKIKWWLGMHILLRIPVFYCILVSQYKIISLILVLVQIKYCHTNFMPVYCPALSYTIAILLA